MSFPIYSDYSSVSSATSPQDQQEKTPTFIVEAFDVNDDGEACYRISVDEHLKIITIQPNVHLSKRIISLENLPTPFPAGEWNFGVVSKCPMTLQPVWTTCLDNWPWSTALWHKLIIDSSTLTTVMRLRPNINIVKSPIYPGVDLIYKFAPFPGGVPLINHESRIYKIISEASDSERVSSGWR